REPGGGSPRSPPRRPSPAPRCSGGGRGAAQPTGSARVLRGDAGRAAVKADPDAAPAPVDGEVDGVLADPKSGDVEAAEEGRLDRVDPEPPGENVHLEPQDHGQEVEDGAR